jgi:DNA-binding transcriptional ArsR family regulator
MTQSEFTQAISHPLRVTILQRLERLAEGEKGVSPKMLSDELDIPLANVAYHVQVLKKVKMIKLADRKPRRGAVEHYYALANGGLTRCPTCGQPLPGGDRVDG